MAMAIPRTTQNTGLGRVEECGSRKLQTLGYFREINPRNIFSCR
jgi:hypothetical protein